MRLQPCWQQLSRDLAQVSDNASYEAKLILCQLLSCEASFLYTYPDHLITSAQLHLLDGIRARRLKGEPLAFILGHGYFYGLKLTVNASTLIPRPDTEVLVEQVLDLALPATAKILDLGTGTGAIALALQKNRPDWQVCAVDQQEGAVALAQLNAQQLGCNIEILQSNWFSALSNRTFDLIVSNPPYIEAEDPHLAALKYEPLTALVAGSDGMADLDAIITTAPNYLRSGGWLWLEHGFNQADKVRACLETAGFCHVSSKRDYGDNWRISGGQYFHIQ